MPTHRHNPDRYYTTLGCHPPVMRVSDGDTVITTTVDARGQDHTGAQVTPRGNPQTGPFFVEGASPGDTLAVRLDRLTPNRPHGWTRSVLAPNVVDPEAVVGLVDAGMARWELDTEAWTATLAEPLTSLGRAVLPLDPMLGCFGVAPAGGEAISTATSARHGGNMDYRRFRAGTTVYFPVAVDGALFCVGDGHATQGDGEIVGTGIETSFEVEFTVRVIKGKQIGWPRGEDGECLFAVGNARPLDQALQHATTEMHRWLQADYGLDSVGASLLMGQAVRYEIANVYDPAYTVACLMEKALLAKLANL